MCFVSFIVSVWLYTVVLGAAGNCHHNCMIIPHSSPVITSSLSNNFFYFLCWARLPDLRTRDLRHHSKMLSDLETDSTLIVGFNTLPRHETCEDVTTLMRSAVSHNYNRSPWDQANPGETWATSTYWLIVPPPQTPSMRVSRPVCWQLIQSL